MIKKGNSDIDLADYEFVIVNSFSVKCSGDKNLYSEHPTVYLEIPKDEGRISCPYCSKKFIISDIKTR